MTSDGKNSGKTVEDVFKSGMDDMIRAREEMEAVAPKIETTDVIESVQPASTDPFQSPAPSGPPMMDVAPTGPPMPEPAPEPTPDPLLTPPTPSGPPMPEVAPEPAPEPQPTSPMPSGPPMGGPGGMPPMGGPGGMPPSGPDLVPQTGPPAEPVESAAPSSPPSEVPNMSVDSSAMPPLGTSNVAPSDVAPTIEPQVEAPPQVTKSPKPKVDNFDDWESHFDNEWEGGAAVYEGENKPPEPEEKFDEVAWDPNAAPIKTIPKLPTKSAMNKMKKGELVELAEAREISSEGTKDQIIQRLLSPDGTLEETPQEIPVEELQPEPVEEIPLEEPELEPELSISEETPSEEQIDSPSSAEPQTDEVDLMSLAGSLSEVEESNEEEPVDEEPAPAPPSGPPPGGPGPMPPSGPPKDE